MIELLASSPVTIALNVIGLALLAGFVTMVTAGLYRLRTKTEFPEGATLLLGLGVVALVLNTRLAFVQFIAEEGIPLEVSDALMNISIFLAAAIASYGGRRLGHRMATSERFDWSRLQPDLSPIVRATGRFITVQLPDQVHDIEGYEPVPGETKQALEGEDLDFPRGLTLDELRAQLAARLKEKHAVGYVDIEIDQDGNVDHLALGQRATGLGPTLPPNVAAVAVRSDPPFSATPGDTVQIWESGPEGQRLGTGELRATVDGSVVTIALEEPLAHRVDSETEYRLMTLSADAYPDREFATLLRRADETMTVVEITEESPFVGVPVGGLALTVIAVQGSDETVQTLPAPERVLEAGDRVFAIGRPERLRKLASSEGTSSRRPGEILRSALGRFAWRGKQDDERPPRDEPGPRQG